MKAIPKEAGKSSFDLLNPEEFLAALPLAGVKEALDLGCGVGNYTLALAGRLTEGARITGVDLWPEGIAALNERAREDGLRNAAGVVGDLADLADFGDETVNFALLATVLHDLVERSEEGRTLEALNRVLVEGATLALVEFKKTSTPPGPPEHVRLSPDEVEALLLPAGFNLLKTVDLGSHLYLSLFRKT